MALTKRQKLFCEHFVKNPSTAEAARQAGYSKNSARQIGYELLSVPEVVEYIDELNAALDKERIADTDECLSLITEIMRDKGLTAAERLKAVDMRLKTLGAYIERLSIDGKTEITVNIGGDISED